VDVGCASLWQEQLALKGLKNMFGYVIIILVDSNMIRKHERPENQAKT
jgi:hypothetical protein